MTLIRDVAVPYQWDRTIGQNNDESVITVFSDGTSWFDVAVYHTPDDEYTVVARRGPEHPHQDEIDEPLREQTAINTESVEQVAVAFMLCASDMDPFTNKFTRGTEIEA